MCHKMLAFSPVLFLLIFTANSGYRGPIVTSKRTVDEEVLLVRKCCPSHLYLDVWYDRVDRGKTIVCQFARWGQGSVRDRIYDSRMSLMRDTNGQMRDRSEQLFVNEKLTHGARAAYLKLREEKRSGRIHSVYTKHGIIHVRIKQHGAKVRVYNRATCEEVLRGVC